MKQKELIRLLKANGWVIEEGTNHHLAVNPEKPGIKIPIPRHSKEIPTGTAHNILKAAGLK